MQFVRVNIKTIVTKTKQKFTQEKHSSFDTNKTKKIIEQNDTIRDLSEKNQLVTDSFRFDVRKKKKKQFLLLKYLLLFYMILFSAFFCC